jgi:hypothetical protein
MGSTSMHFSAGAASSTDTDFVESEAAYAQRVQASVSRNKADPRPPVSHAQAKEMMGQLLQDKLQSQSAKKRLHA